MVKKYLSIFTILPLAVAPAQAGLWRDAKGDVIAISLDRGDPPHLARLNVALCRPDPARHDLQMLALQFAPDGAAFSARVDIVSLYARSDGAPHSLQMTRPTCDANSLSLISGMDLAAIRYVRETDADGDRLRLQEMRLTRDGGSYAVDIRALPPLFRDRRADPIRGRWGVKEYRVVGEEHRPLTDPRNFVHDDGPYMMEPPGADATLIESQRYDCFNGMETFDLRGHKAALSRGRDGADIYEVFPLNDGRFRLRYKTLDGGPTHYCETEGLDLKRSMFDGFDGLDFALETSSGDLVGTIPATEARAETRIRLERIPPSPKPPAARE